MAPTQDSIYRERMDSYRGFIRLTAFATASIIAIVGLMAIFLL